MPSYWKYHLEIEDTNEIKEYLADTLPFRINQNFPKIYPLYWKEMIDAVLNEIKWIKVLS